MKNSTTRQTGFSFLQGGGEMGRLMRFKDWSETLIGLPGEWPQSLRTTLSIILNSKFPMFLFWGPDLICFYNDAYRPSLGNDGKHPNILGSRGEDYWQEIWPVIKPLIDQVLAGGEATWSEDQLIPIYRNGKLEDVYWTFSYSPVNDESGKPAGVFVTCNETTDKVITRNKLEESKDQLEFAIDAAELGTWDYNPFTNKFSANERLKVWFGFPAEEELDLSVALDAIADKDRQRIANAIQAVLQFSSGGHFDSEFTLINYLTKKEMIVRGIGKAWFNKDNLAYRFTGTLHNVTEQVIAQRKLEESERNLRLMILQAPVAMCVFKGENHVVEIANEKMLELWGRPATDVINKPIFEGLPEAKGQGLETIVDNVFKKGERFQANERPVNLPRKDKIETTYINFVYEPLKNADGAISGILAIANDVTLQVIARKKIEESEEQLRIALEGGELGTFDFYPETDTLIWSDKTKEFFGLPPDAEVNYGIYLNAIHPEDRNASKSIAEQQAKLMEGGFYELEYRTIGVNDGRIRWIRSKGKVNYNAKGKPVRYSGVTQDITQLKLAEEKLRQFKFMADNASDPFILTDEEGKFPYLNKKALEKWGYTEEEAKHIDGRDVDTVVDNPESYKEIFEKALHGNLPPFETMHRHKSGATYPVEINMTTLMLDGKPHLFAVARDITERKKAEQALRESEEKFRSMAESSDILIGVNDETINAVYFNKVWEKLTGRKVEDLMNLGWADLVHPDDRQPFLDKFFHAFKNKESYSGEFRILNKDGNYSWLYAKVQVRLHPDGSYAGHISSCIDITERKQSEEAIKKSEDAIKESEQRLRSLVEGAPFPIGVYTGREMRIQLVNQSILDVWGKNRDIIGKKYADVLPELEGSGIFEALDHVFTTGTPFHSHNQPIYLTAFGNEPHYFNYSFTPLYDIRGNIYGVLNTAAEVTDLEIAKQKVEESEKRLSIIIEASELGNWELNLKTREANYSDRYLEILGYHERVDLTHDQILRHLHPEDRYIRENAFKEAMVTGILHYESRIIWNDKSIHWIEGMGKVFYDDNRGPSKMIGTVRDITEEKKFRQELLQREQKFRLLADSMPQHIWTADTAGNLNYYNQSVFNYSGLSLEEINKNGWIEIVHPDDREENIKVWMNAVTTGEDFRFEHRFRRYDGEYRWQLSRAVPQRDSEGNIQMWVGTSTDIDDIKKNEQLKDDFIKMASHELKTPVTTIKGYVQFLMSMNKADEETKLAGPLSTINKQVDKLTKLITDLLDVTKIETGRLYLSKESFNINQLIAEITEELQATTVTHQISFMPGPDVLVFADRDRISQVLINLVVNAVKYSPGQQKVVVSSGLAESEIIISVQDFGIGISPENYSRIFERFFRVQGKNEKTFPGFGIGLFIVKEIMANHGGKVWVESGKGQGSVFYFSLPYK